MVKKVVKNTKVTKATKTPRKTPAKPKGKVVKALAVESIADVAEPKKIGSNVSTQTLVAEERITKALNELTEFIKRAQDEDSEKAQLFEDELISEIQLQFTKSSLWTSKMDLKPRIIQVTKKSQENKPTVALFVRDGSVDKELLEKIEASELNNAITQIISGNELKTTYKPFEKRRQLFAQYDLFLADDALVTTLPKLLGKTFYESKKLPIPINVGKNGFKIEKVLNEVNKVNNGIVYRTPRSDNLVVQLGSLDSVTAEIISQVISQFAKEDLRGIFIKSNSSPALPLFEAAVAFTESTEEPKTEAKNNNNTMEIGGEQVKLSSFERALVELAHDSEVPKLLAGKVKQAKKAKKVEAKKQITANTEKSKIVKTVKKTTKAKK